MVLVSNGYRINEANNTKSFLPSNFDIGVIICLNVDDMLIFKNCK